MMIEFSAKLFAWWSVLTAKLRQEDGASESTEKLILLGIVAAIATAVGAFLLNYVNGQMAKVP